MAQIKNLNFSISQLAQEFNISTRTIRFYEEKGLLLPLRKKGGQRSFNKKDRTRLKLILRGKHFGLSLDEIVQFDWQVALGDQVLSRQELETLAKLKEPLVKIRGQWVQLTAEEIQAALDFWNQKDRLRTFE